METETDMSKTLSELKTRLRSLLGDRLKKFVLYGSRARGDYDDNSDIDVADVELTYFTPLSTLILDEKMYNELLRRERRIALDIQHEGVPL